MNINIYDFLFFKKVLLFVIKRNIKCLFEIIVYNKYNMCNYFFDGVYKDYRCKLCFWVIISC